MKSKSVFAIFLLCVGAIALIYQGISWMTPHSTGAAAEKPHTVRPALIIAGIALGCGSLLFLSARKEAAAGLLKIEPLKKQI